MILPEFNVSIERTKLLTLKKLEQKNKVFFKKLKCQVENYNRILVDKICTNVKNIFVKYQTTKIYYFNSCYFHITLETISNPCFEDDQITCAKIESLKNKTLKIIEQNYIENIQIISSFFQKTRFEIKNEKSLSSYSTDYVFELVASNQDNTYQKTIIPIDFSTCF